MTTKTKQVMEEEIQQLENEWSNKDIRRSIIRILKTAMEEATDKPIDHSAHNKSIRMACESMEKLETYYQYRIQKILNSIKK